MDMLIAGLVIFLGVHALRVWGEGLRSALVLKLGAMGFKGVYSIASLAGLYLLILGYGQARLEPVPLWTPPRGMGHATLALMWISMVMLASSMDSAQRDQGPLASPYGAGRQGLGPVPYFGQRHAA